MPLRFRLGGAVTFEQTFGEDAQAAVEKAAAACAACHQAKGVPKPP